MARGDGPAGWYGWPTDPRLETLRTGWMDASDDGERQRIVADIQTELWRQATFVPLGQIFQPQAIRSNLSGVLPGFVKFYNVEKTG